MGLSTTAGHDSLPAFPRFETLDRTVFYTVVIPIKRSAG